MVVFGLFIVVLLLSYLLLIAFFYVFQESFLFQAKSMNRDEAFEFDFPFEERNVKMEDGAVINTVMLRATNAKGVMLYFHGNSGDLTRWAPIANAFTEYGFDVLVFDYRGYGKSRGHRSMQRLYRDGLVLYESLLESYREDDIVIYGRSIGTSMATWLAARTKAQQLLLETPFYQISEVLAFRFLMLPASLLLKYPFSNAKYMGSVSSPIHIVHGTLDGVVPYFSGKKLYQAFRDQKVISFTTINGGRHNNLIQFPEFRRWIEERLVRL
ncbi:MAG: alpha/beta hydrolase [Cryomorphaceae bacterium]